MSSEPQETGAISTTNAWVNFTTACLNIANPAGAVVGASRLLYGWLERSGVDESNFERCMTAARSLAYPNKNGMELRDSVAKADDRLEKLKNGQLPLMLQSSQALGRYIVKDPEVCYMASTTACLFTHHDLSYAKSALTSMVLDKGGHETETKYTYEVWRAPTKAVISKLVESIFFNISNPGHQTPKFPPELADFHVHLVDDINFGAIVMQIQKTSNDLLLRADRFPGDVLLWLFNHFEGYLEVYVKSAKVYEAKLGLHTRKITTDIKETCSDDHETCIGRSWPVVLAEIVDGERHRLVGASSSEDLKPRSYQRQKLYNTKNLTNDTHISHKAHLGREERNEIKYVARHITKWLMHVPTNVKDWPQFAGFCFQTELELDEDRDRSRDFNIARLLFRSPSLSQERTGESTSSAPIFRRPSWQGSPMSSQNTDPEEWGSNTTPEEVLKNFPCAEEMLKNTQKCCQCLNCRSEGSFSGSKKGCLRYSAVLELCILISHAVADALGVEDVSGAADPEDAMLGIITLLSEVIDQGVVRWDTWFQVAACAVTGCSWRSFADMTGDSEGKGGTSRAGVQYGSLAVLAPWLDFRAPLKITGSFRIQVFEGNIQGIKDDIALIQTEQASANCNENFDRVDIVPNLWQKLLNTDDTPFDVQNALCRAENSLHRLLAIVKVKDHLRLVDPTRSMINLSRSQKAVCSHRRPSHSPKQLEETLGSNLNINACTFEEIFAQWVSNPNTGAKGDGRTSLDLSLVIDDLRKVQISLALSDGGVILRNSSECCLPCALKSRLDSSTEPEGFRSILSFIPTNLRMSRKQIEGPANTQVEHSSSINSSPNRHNSPTDHSTLSTRRKFPLVSRELLAKRLLKNQWTGYSVPS
ncbi:hypothetical protein MMC28_001463 [Mycoblastus sanguinarius]|nr:hypothetical protein [Mycoblastus sanguinarius]